MPPKAKLPAPIDRPLSRAYLRQFTGWSTAEPPGVSDPTSLRIMENVQINRDGSCRVRPGLRYLSYSQAPFSPTPVPLVTPQLWGSSVLTPSGSSSYGAPTTSIAMPAGTQVGDLLILSLIGGYGPAATCTDPRMTLVAQTNVDTRGSGVWMGYATDLSPLIISVQGNASSIGQFSMAALYNMRGADGNKLEWNPSAVAVHASDTSTTATLPALAHPDLSAAICVYQTCGGIGGVYPDQNWLKSGTWNMMIAHDNSYIETDVGYVDGNDIPAEVTPNTDGTSAWTAVVIGLQGDSSGTAGSPTGLGCDRPLVGSHEAFYLNDGTKAYLVAVREEDDTVGFRVLVLDANGSTMYPLDHPDIDFEVRQTPEELHFTAATTYVKYLQIDNKIFALSDAGEPMRLFTVGAHKEAKALAAITRPEWEVEDKLSVVHPDADWINAGEPSGKRRNLIRNPSFETNQGFWSGGPMTKLSRPAALPFTPFSGERVLKLESKPTRTNLVSSPLHNVAATGVGNWDGYTHSWIPQAGAAGGVGFAPTATVEADGDYLKLVMPATKGVYFARSHLLPGVEPGTRYQVAYDATTGAGADALCMIRFFGVTGVQVGEDVVLDVSDATGRWVSDWAFTAPKNAVSARVFIGGRNTTTATTHVRAKNVMLCPADESTAMFHGGTGANYFWTDQANNSASVYHPPAAISVVTDPLPVKAGKAYNASLYMRPGSTARDATLNLICYNKHGALVDADQVTVAETAATRTRIDVGTAATPGSATKAQLQFTVPAVPRGEFHYIEAVLLEPDTAVVGDYFDGSTADVPTARQSWLGDKHASVSLQETFTVAETVPVAETPTVDTLVATGGHAVNEFSFGFFYTFDNEVGESAASRTTIRRAQRAWADWAWETPNAAGEPSGTNTNTANRCADQLVAIMPQDVFDEAIAEGATSWNLYMFTWSNQDAAPVSAFKVGTKELRDDATYDRHGWIRVTPAQAESTDLAPLPTKGNRYNYSDPSRAGQGLVAADRLVLVHDPTAAAVIRYSSNRLGEYGNFTAAKGGGYKTLTSGNLYVPAAVKLWQNPQSADTITILCQGTDGHSTSYYMAPAQVASQSEAVNIMGFEETTATPGTTSPYGVEVFNNSLYHPLDDQLMKSTASNYNINHKGQTDLIHNMWEKLATKHHIVSSVHDGRLYYLVNNPEGAPLEDGCWGNEVWVLDGQAKTGTWSRFLVQGQSLRTIEFGGRLYMSVLRPDGIYYLDPGYGLDDFVGDGLAVSARPIPWKLETNTQGANRAHDAWCHLQQVGISLGYFQGRMRYGIRAWDIHGKPVDIAKVVTDKNAPSSLAYDLEDYLQIRRDLQQWFFYAESITDEAGEVEPSYGQLSLVGYRYTPSSVNTGYEQGSVESFQYGRDVAEAPSTSVNGIPVPQLDTRRP